MKSSVHDKASIENNVFDEKEKTASIKSKTQNSLQKSLQEKSQTQLSLAGKTMRDYPFNIKNVSKERVDKMNESYFYINDKPT